MVGENRIHRIVILHFKILLVMPFWDCFVTLLLHAHFLPSRFDYSLAIILVFAFFSCFTLALPMR